MRNLGILMVCTSPLMIVSGPAWPKYGGEVIGWGLIVLCFGAAFWLIGKRKTSG